MPVNIANIEYEAVLFLASSEVCAQYKIDEFDSLLDGIFRAPEYAGQTLEAVFIQLDANLALRRLVFFNLTFAEDGSVQASWNLPLRQLAEKGITGPTINGHALQIFHPKNNTVASYEPFLWIPSAATFKTLIATILSAIEKNSLGFKIVQALSVSEEVANSEDEDIFADNSVSSVTAESELTQPTSTDKSPSLTERLLEMEPEQSVEQEMSRQLRNQEQAFKQKLLQLQRKCNQLEVQNDHLAGQLLEKNEQLEDLDFKYAQVNERLASLKDEQLALLRLQQTAHNDNECDDSVKQQLQQQITMLKEQLQQALQREQAPEQAIPLLEAAEEVMSAEQLIEKMIEQELVFTVYHSGAGHFNLSARSVASYLDNPLVYAAQKCAVRLQDYQLWLKHFEEPRCFECNKSVKRVGHPSDFNVNIDGYCSEHARRE